MLRQQAVVVGDVDDILQVLDKQKVRLSVNMSRCVRVAAFRQYRGLEIGAAKCLPTSQLNGVFQMMYCQSGHDIAVFFQPSAATRARVPLVGSLVWDSGRMLFRVVKDTHAHTHQPTPMRTHTISTY